MPSTKEYPQRKTRQDKTTPKPNWVNFILQLVLSAADDGQPDNCHKIILEKFKRFNQILLRICAGFPEIYL